MVGIELDCRIAPIPKRMIISGTIPTDEGHLEGIQVVCDFYRQSKSIIISNLGSQGLGSIEAIPPGGRSASSNRGLELKYNNEIPQA